MRFCLRTAPVLVMLGWALIGCNSSESDNTPPEPNQVVLTVEPLV